MIKSTIDKRCFWCRGEGTEGSTRRGRWLCPPCCVAVDKADPAARAEGHGYVRPQTAHIVMGPEPAWATCTRCGEKLAPLSLPTRIEVVLAYQRGFIAAHRSCKAAPRG